MTLDANPFVAQADSYGAEQMRRAFSTFINSGGGVVGANDLQVTALSTPNMSVNVSSGQVWVPGTLSTQQGQYYGLNNATMNVLVPGSDPTNPRIDLIAVVVDDAAYGQSSTGWQIVDVPGTPAASPTIPTAPANSIVLAQIAVNAAVSSITSADITDKRVFAGVDGRIQDNGGQVFNVKAYGAKGDGVTDDTVAIQSAINACGTAGGGIVFLPLGTYIISATLTLSDAAVSLIGASIAASVISPNSSLTGSVLSLVPASFTYTHAGTYADFTIDGANAPIGSIGCVYGNLIGGKLDFEITNFSGGGKGLIIDNTLAWTERTTGRVRVDNATTAYTFTVTQRSDAGCTFTNGSDIVDDTSTIASDLGKSVSIGSIFIGAITSVTPGVSFTLSTPYTGTTGSYTALVGGTNSFGYSNLTFEVNTSASESQTGVIIQNGAYFYNSSLEIIGNINSGSTVSTGIHITGSSTVTSSFCKFQIEQTSGTGAVGLQIDSGSALGAVGVIDLSSTTTTAVAGNFQFSGWVSLPDYSYPSDALAIVGNAVSNSNITASGDVTGGALRITSGAGTDTVPNIWNNGGNPVIGSANTNGTVILRPSGGGNPNGQLILNSNGGLNIYESSGVSASTLYSGSGAPTISGVSGDYYFRTDTPTTSLQRIYVCTGGTTWTGIL